MSARVTQISFEIDFPAKTMQGAVLNTSLLMMEEKWLSDRQKLLTLLKYFTSIFTAETDSEPLPLPKYEIPFAMSMGVITVPMVEKRLKNLDTSKAASSNRIHPRLLKETASKVSLLFVIWSVFS